MRYASNMITPMHIHQMISVGTKRSRQRLQGMIACFRSKAHGPKVPKQVEGLPYGLRAVVLS